MPGAAAGAGGAGDFSGLLDGMTKQLMTKEILEEPLAELGEKVCLFSPHISESRSRSFPSS